MYRRISLDISLEDGMNDSFGGRFPGQGFGASMPQELWDTLGQVRQGLEQTFGQGFGQVFGQKVGTRVGRGDVRAAILSLLAEQPMHGYQIIQQIEERSGGSWRPSPGSVYPTLQLLTDEGMIEVEESAGRKTYSLTEAGREEAAGADRPWAADSDAGEGRAQGGFPGGSHGGSHGALPKAGAHLAQAAMQVQRTGTPEQITEAVEVLDDARRKLYAILAQS
jgi:DNA-binding PadR family transcriptional regulator